MHHLIQREQQTKDRTSSSRNGFPSVGLFHPTRQCSSPDTGNTFDMSKKRASLGAERASSHSPQHNEVKGDNPYAGHSEDEKSSKETNTQSVRITAAMREIDYVVMNMFRSRRNSDMQTSRTDRHKIAEREIAAENERLTATNRNLKSSLLCMIEELRMTRLEIEKRQLGDEKAKLEALVSNIEVSGLCPQGEMSPSLPEFEAHL